jgi:hypothetical protein
MEIPQYFATSKCKTVKAVDKTRIEYLNCNQNVKKTDFLGFTSGCKLEFSPISKLQIVPFIRLNFSFKDPTILL